MMWAAGGTAVTVGVASALDPLPVWVVVVSLVMSSLLNPFGFGGLSSFVGGPGLDARRAYAFDALSYNVSAVAGPLIVALMAPTLGARAAMLTMALVALCSLVTYPFLAMQPRKTSSRNPVRSMTAGVTAMAVHRRLAVVTTSGTVTEFGRGVLPIAAIGIALITTGDAASSAVIVAAFGVGALAGAALETMRRHWLSPQARMASGYVLTGIATITAGLGLGFEWVVIFVGLSGLFTAAPNAAMLLLRRTESPEAIVAQVFTVGAALRVAAGAAGTALAGAAAGFDPHYLLFFSGLVWILGAAIMALYPRRHPH